MSEQYTTFGRLTICVQDDGLADITHDFGPVDDDDSLVSWQTVVIPAEHRRAVALALLGPLSDDVIDGIIAAVQDCCHPSGRCVDRDGLGERLTAALGGERGTA